MKPRFDRTLLLLSAALFTTHVAASGLWEQTAVPPQRLSELSPAAVQAVAIRLNGGPAELGSNWSLPLASGGRSWQTTALAGSADGDFRWRGVAIGDPDAQAVVVRRGRALSGFISTHEAVYELIPAADGNYLVELDSARFPQCGGSVVAEVDSAPEPGPVLVGATQGGTVSIDVLIVYTPEARDAAGGVSGMEAVALAAVEAANQSFENAQATPRFRLVAARLANYNDSGNSSDDLTWVRSDSQVAAWRDELGADMVGLIANNIGGSCGRGYVMRSPGAGFAGSAFQVTARGCAVGNLSYAHEHGHNMGMEHDPANGTSPGSASFPFSFGHYVSGSYRTVMSYSSECTGGCTRRPYFSNPDVSFMGTPTGIANERVNAQTATNVASIVAAFRADAGFLFEDGFE